MHTTISGGVPTLVPRLNASFGDLADPHGSRTRFVTRKAGGEPSTDDQLERAVKEARPA
jgi:hypothetical protein